MLMDGVGKRVLLEEDVERAVVRCGVRVGWAERVFIVRIQF